MALLSLASCFTASHFPGVWPVRFFICLWPSSCQLWLTPVPSLPCLSRRPLGPAMSPGIAYRCL